MTNFPQVIEELKQLYEDWVRARRIADQLTLETQTVTECVSDLVRQVREARALVDKYEIQRNEAQMALSELRTGSFNVPEKPSISNTSRALIERLKAEILLEVEKEPEPEGPPPVGLAGQGLEVVARIAVKVTKRNISDRIRLIEPETLLKKTYG